MTEATYTTQLQPVSPDDVRGEPLVFASEKGVFADSRAVAAYFEKRHDNVMRDISKLVEMSTEMGLPKNGEGGVLNFEETPYVEPTTGQTYKSYVMTREGFELLAMGFTGAKALKWKMSYVKAFKAMEEQLRKPQAIDYNDPRVILGAFQHLQMTCNEQATVIAQQGERLQQLDRIEGAYGSMCLTDAAKTLKKPPQELIRFMQSREMIFKRVGNTSWIGRQHFINTGLLEHKEHIYTGSDGTQRVATRVMVTGKGLVKLAEMLESPLH